MSTTRIPRSSTALLAAVLCAGLAAFAALSPDRPAVVATVDLERVFNSVDLQTRTEVRLQAMSEQLGARRDELRLEIEDLQAELESFQPGSDAQIEVAGRIEEAIAEFRAWEGFAAIKLEAEQSKAMRDIYLSIREAAATLAKERGWDYVLVDDTVPTIQPGGAEQMQQQIGSRRFLYANGAFDVTDELVARLNTQSASASGD
jgi:Skp family chaperone for outer membrane proteins